MSGSITWKQSLVWKITLSYLLFTVLPFMLFYAFTFGYWWNSSVDKTVAHTEKLLQYDKNLIQIHLDQMRKLSVSIYYDQLLMSLLQSEDLPTDEKKQVQMIYQFDHLFQTMSETRSDIFNYYYFDLNGGLMYVYNNGILNSFTPLIKYNPGAEAWFRQVKEANGKDLLLTAELPIHPKSDSFLSMARLIKNNTQPIGVILLDFNFNVLNKTIDRSNLDNDSDFIISDQTGRVVYSTRDQPPYGRKDNLTGDIHASIAAGNSGSFRTEIGQAQYLVVYDTLNPFSLKLLHLIPISQLIYKPLNHIVLINLFIFLSMLVFISLSIYYFYRRMNPLKKLSSIMDHVIAEPFDQRFQDSTIDEIGKLSFSFSKMMNRIHDLIEVDYKNKIKIAESEKKMLESQINPHFLYNTLDTIRFKSIEKGHAEVADMLLALSKNLQYTVTKLGKKVKVVEEIEWLERYIYLQKLRFKERFEAFFEIDIAIFDIDIYPLVLQPFVENAILHGFRNTESGGILHINGYLDQSEWICFEIVDNGCGFDREVDRTYRLHDVEQPEHEGIGISNVLNRLFLYYGDLCEVDVSSRPGKYTAIRIKLHQPYENKGGSLSHEDCAD